MRNLLARQRLLLAVFASLAIIIGLVLFIGATAQLPGPSTISSSELSYIATDQAQQEFNPHVVRVRCPPGTFQLGATLTCEARLQFARLVVRVDRLSVTVHRDDGGELYIDVRRA